MTDDEMRELAKDLAWDKPDAERREAVRSSLLMAAAEREEPTTRRAWWGVAAGFAAGVAAAAAVLLLLARGDKEPIAAPQPQQAAMTSARATIEASSAANFEREVTTSSGGGIDEVVHLHGGKLRLAVGELAATEHVRVQVGTSVVEGSGDYEVAVADDVLKEVTVGQGSVKVDVKNQQAVFLATGQTWRAPIETAVVDVPAPAPVAPDHVVATRDPAPEPSTPVPGPRTQDPGPSTQDPGPSPQQQPQPPAPPVDSHAVVEEHFQAGYAALHAGRFDDAAAELGAAADASATDPLAIDARYLQATALVQAHRPGDAETALIAFLDHAPQSMRRGRAAVMLGRLIADRGDAASSRKWFESALHDADASVAAAAQAGLAALDRIR